MNDTVNRPDEWHDPDHERDDGRRERRRRRKVPVDEWAEYEAWRSERGARGRKRRGKAGGRRDANRQRQADD